MFMASHRFPLVSTSAPPHPAGLLDADAFPEEVVVAYHERTKHHFHRYAASPGYMDWATQPDPFRRYQGADLVRLPLAKPGRPLPYWQLYALGDVSSEPLTLESISLFFRYALSLTAWKRFHDTTWSLRANPSSGNLHPTEGYAVLPAIDRLGDAPAVYHYAPKEHALERRAILDAKVWSELCAPFPEGSFLAGLSSIHWREAWKYGERAFRYCQHDAGHALATLRIAAAALGWGLVLLGGISDRAIAGLFGLSRGDDYGTAEREEPELLALVTPGLPSTSPVTPDGRWLILDELCGDDIGFSTFADCVLELCAERFDGYKFEDYGDPAGAQRSAMTADKAEKTCFDILQGKGIGIQLGGQNLTIRLESVRKPLNTLREGKPQFQISPRCEMLRKGFLGRYQYRRVKVSGSAERYHDEPEKNEYSHPHDALQYVATRVFADAVRGWEEQRKQWSRPIEELYAARMKEMRGNIV